MEDNDRKRRAEIRRRRKKRQILLGRILVALLLLVVLALSAILLEDYLSKKGIELPALSWLSAGIEANSVTEKQTETISPEERLLREADHMAAQYDYDGAIAHLTGSELYEGNTKLQEAAAGYEATKATCIEYTPEQVTHVFYHTLIYDTKKAFASEKADGYNQMMTTVSEFNAITRSMYDRGYVMVSMHDICEVNEDGTVSRKNILLPPDKKPFVLSQDDVSYYHYMEGSGFATKLVLDEKGRVKNEYKNDDGSISVGDYDMIPLIDTFVEEHPDFSYHGRKGIIALTGYNGILGYRTDIAYKTGENLEKDQSEWLASNPDFDYNEECRQAKEVADAMKASGWEFASHTWGHMDTTNKSVDAIKTDTEKWMSYVSPLIGDTDVLIFSFGADIGAWGDRQNWQPYTEDNEKFSYLRSQGFSIFCNVDSSQYWVQFGNTYMRQARRNLDGYRMYYSPDLLTDLFDVSKVWDNTRPTPVPSIS